MRIEAQPSNRPERVFSGLGISIGVAIGRAWVADTGSLPTPEYAIPPDGVAAERARFAAALELALKQLRKLKSKAAALPDAVSEELGYLLDARLQMLSGSRLVRGVDARIERQGINAEAAVRAEIATIVASFAGMDDAYLSARADDIREVGDRLLRNLLKAPYQALQHVPEGSILIAEDLSPADTVLLDPRKTVGFATALGGAQSHTAIVARSLGMPAVLGVPGLIGGIEGGDLVIIDGNAGRVVINPTEATVARYAELARGIADERAALVAGRDLPSMTSDGLGIELHANLELPREVAHAALEGAAGVGLLRTEFMFMNRETAPSEDEQYAVFRAVVEGMAGRPVTIRTLDIGGDKLAPSLKERIGDLVDDCVNPALGMRGIRLSLAESKLFDTQLAAILRASAHGPTRILLPMVSSLDEVKAARAAIARVIRRLRRRREPVATTPPPVGVMIEVPGAALAADALATMADFFAVGTNDLTMYTLAIDRGDERVANLYNPLHPAVLRLIQFTVQAAARGRLPISVCGEIAGDPRYTALLLGLGVRQLSMAAPNLPRVKQRVRALDLADATRHANVVMEQWDQSRIADLVDAYNGHLTDLKG